MADQDKLSCNPSKYRFESPPVENDELPSAKRAVSGDRSPGTKRPALTVQVITPGESLMGQENVLIQTFIHVTENQKWLCTNSLYERQCSVWKNSLR